MKALVCQKLGDPTLAPSANGALRLESNHLRPKLTSKTAIRIKVHAGSLNFADVLMVQGKYQERPQLPFIPGSEAAGVVLEVGPAVSRFKAGDSVCVVCSGGGAFAEEVVAEETAVFALPAGCDLEAAAGLPIAFGTAHVGLVHRANLQAGQVLLVLGAAGGVGVAAVQLGVRLGAKVIAVARGEAKAKLLQKLGAALVIDTSKGQTIKEEVQKFLKAKKRRGVDVLFDPVGGAQFKEALRTVGWGAQIVIIGFASGEVPTIQANLALVKNLTIHGLYWGSHMVHRPQVLLDSMKELLECFADGSITVPVSHKFPLEQAHHAFAAMSRREALGKVLITMDHAARSLSPLMGYGGGSIQSRL